jgi:RNA methyltransferase, TrmH family
MLSQGETRLLHALKSRAGRDKHGAFMVEGVRAIEDLVAAGIDLKFAVVSPTFEDSIRGRALTEALELRTTVRRLKDHELRALSETETPQGVLAVAFAPKRMLSDIQLRAASLVLVLDAIQDPGNLGTLIRSADAFAVTCVIALPGTVDYWNPKVVRAAAGSAFRVPLIHAETDETWAWLAQHDFTVFGADMQGESVADARASGNLALVAGNEGSGLRRETREHVTHTIAIPMPGHAESLNVGVAAGILLYELSRTDR